jgi:Fur family iron response transcriptional regulator
MTKLQEGTGHEEQDGYNFRMNSLNKNDQKFPLSRSEVVLLLQQHGVTPTRQRVEIAGFMYQRPQHLSAEKILEGVNSEGHRVSRATVYNTMGLFTEKGLVREVLIDRERVFYDSNISEHFHIYDLDNGELRDVMDAQAQLISAPDLPEGVRIVDTDIIFKVSSKPD